MKYIHNILNHPKRESIEKRLEIIQFFDEFGEAATKKAFGKGRSTIYLWKQKLKKADGKLSALAPEDKTPIHKRKRLVHPFIEQCIIEYRTSHPGADKTTITPVLNTACKLAGIKPISESTIGRIIRDLLVVTPLLEGGEPSADGVGKAIERAFVRFDLLEHQRPVALSVRYPWEKSYNALKTLALGVLQTKGLWKHQNPLVLVLDADIGKLVGAILKEELGLEQEVVAIDEIVVGDFDFIDIGEELGHSQAVPVVVKSLVFK